MFPGDPHGSAEEVINCRCTCNTRARWALDEEELQALKERAEYFGLDKAKDFEEFREKYLTVSQKMAAHPQGNDWSGTVAKALARHEKQEVIKYAKELDVELSDIDSFDGDIELLKAEISTVSKVCKDYGLKTRVNVSAMVLEDDSDFAITDGHTIVFNSKALRDRRVTEYNITENKQFASKTLEDIALHETGHIIAKENHINGLEIAKKAYYNTTGKYVSPKQLRLFLKEEISPYSSTVPEEIAAEVIVRNKNKPTKFTKAFVSLMRGENSNEKD